MPITMRCGLKASTKAFNGEQKKSHKKKVDAMSTLNILYIGVEIMKLTPTSRQILPVGCGYKKEHENEHGNLEIKSTISKRCISMYFLWWNLGDFPASHRSFNNPPEAHESPSRSMSWASPRSRSSLLQRPTWRNFSPEWALDISCI